MESFLEAWDLICDYCKKQVTDVSYETWFSKLVPISLDFGAGVAIIQAPNEFNKSTIERGFHKCLNDAVQSVFGEAFTYKLITPMEKKEKERVPDDDEYEYTFETFIEGSSNKFACAACRYVAKEPAKNYNPLLSTATPASAKRTCSTPSVTSSKRISRIRISFTSRATSLQTS